MYDWREISDFPGYSVCSNGDVRNDKTDRLLKLCANQSGTVMVGLVKNRVQSKRSVALLVAEEYLRIRPHSAFDTPINLDGNRFNNKAHNLMWRPRWFAIKYHMQFKRGVALIPSPIQDRDSKEWFKDSLDAAKQYGLLDIDILESTLNRSVVWPSFQRFYKPDR